jgi:chromosome segregation ATPase
MTSNSHAGSSALVQKIIKLCDELLDKVDESWTLERRAEEERNQSYTNYKRLLNKDMNAYNSQIADLETEIASLTDRLNATTDSLNEVNDRISDKNTRMSDRTGECNEAAYDYQERRKKRDEDRDTVSQLIGIVNANMRDLKEIIALRLAAGDDFS